MKKKIEEYLELLGFKNITVEEKTKILAMRFEYKNNSYSFTLPLKQVEVKWSMINLHNCTLELHSECGSYIILNNHYFSCYSKVGVTSSITFR